MKIKKKKQSYKTPNTQHQVNSSMSKVVICYISLSQLIINIFIACDTTLSQLNN